MKITQPITDKLAIGLSSICVLHCLALPFLLILLPSIAVLPLEDETFHRWMIAAIFPSSVYALTLGYKQHKRYQLFILGLTGLTLLVLALVLEEYYIGEVGEKMLTTLGSCFIIIGHGLNYHFCLLKKHKDCTCLNGNSTDT